MTGRANLVHLSFSFIFMSGYCYPELDAHENPILSFLLYRHIETVMHSLKQRVCLSYVIARSLLDDFELATAQAPVAQLNMV